jgi:hypothetical protein
MERLSRSLAVEIGAELCRIRRPDLPVLQEVLDRDVRAVVPRRHEAEVVNVPRVQEQRFECPVDGFLVAAGSRQGPSRRHHRPDERLQISCVLIEPLELVCAVRGDLLSLCGNGHALSPSRVQILLRSISRTSEGDVTVLKTPDGVGRFTQNGVGMSGPRLCPTRIFNYPPPPDPTRWDVGEHTDSDLLTLLL